MSIKLEIKTLTSRLIPVDPSYPGIVEFWGYLDMILSYEIHNSFYIKAMSSNRWIQNAWDGRNHLFNAKKGEFLTGLLPQVIEGLKQYNIPYEIDDQRMIYEKGEELEVKFEPRPYQKDSVDKILEKKRGIVFARPRSGKTLIFIMLVAKTNIYPVLSICQSIDIAKQTIDKVKKFLPQVNVGLIGDGICDIQDVTIATIQSLSAAYDIKETILKDQVEKSPATEKKILIQKLVETSKVVWVDECHHSSSATYRHVLQNKVYAAEYILGCSGTPFREDNTNLLIEGLVGPIIYEIDYSKLIQEGFLVRPTIHLIKLPKNIEFRDKDAYATIYSKGVIENNIRNDTIAKAVHSLVSKNKTCMVLVNKISHGKKLAQLIPCAKFSYSKSEDRATLWHQLKIRKLKCLITTLGDEGIDMPSLDATIIAAGGESAIKVFQRLRCLTPFEGKTHAIVVDFMDPYKYLKSHSKKREKLYKSEPSFRITYKEIK